jgi:hypothetical protein
MKRVDTPGPAAWQAVNRCMRDGKTNA